MGPRLGSYCQEKIVQQTTKYTLCCSENLEISFPGMCSGTHTETSLAVEWPEARAADRAVCLLRSPAGEDNHVTGLAR